MEIHLFDFFLSSPEPVRAGESNPPTSFANSLCQCIYDMFTSKQIYIIHKNVNSFECSILKRKEKLNAEMVGISQGKKGMSSVSDIRISWHKHHFLLLAVLSFSSSIFTYFFSFGNFNFA